MENLNKALDAQAKAFDKDKITAADQKKHEKLVAAAAKKDSEKIEDEIDAITADIEKQIAEDRIKEEKAREEIKSIKARNE